MPANPGTGNASFGARLKELMRWRGFNKRRLAHAIRVNESYIGNLCRDKVASPGSTYTRAICSQLQCEFIYLMDGTGPKWIKGTEPRSMPPSPDGRRRENREDSAISTPR